MFVYPASKRESLNSLSKEIWGSPSKWMSVLNKGLLVEDEVHPITKRTIRSHVEYYTLQELELIMADLKSKMDASKPK